MNHSAVIFPDTVPSERILIPLVQVFDELVYFQSVENDAVPAELNTPFIEAMIGADSCRFSAPAPLGENLAKFNHLVDDIRNRRADYGVQFAHASLASVPSLARKAKESKSSLISDLLAAKGIREKEDDRNFELLWQARLVLKLAEIFDADQESLRRDLQALHNREENLLGELRKEEKSLFALTGKLTAVSPVTDEMVQMRLKAWARLCVQGHTVLPDKPIFLTSSGDGFEMLAEAFEEISGGPPVQLGSLSLPANCPDTKQMVRQINLFREEAKEMRDCFFSGLDRCQGERGDSAAASWESILEKFFPTQSHGRIRMRICCCPDMAPEYLFGASFLGDSRPAAKEQASGPGVFIGLLERV